MKNLRENQGKVEIFKKLFLQLVHKIQVCVLVAFHWSNACQVTTSFRRRVLFCAQS